jgi:adenylosuccinate lyase
MAETHPLRSRYTSKDMQLVFSDGYKFPTWRKCWIALAEGEKELGIEQIKPEHIEALKKFQNDVPYERANELERKLRHDVMAHINAYKEQVEAVCPGAGGIIHLGATSMYPCDNTELLQMREGMDIIIGKAINVFRRMKPFAEEYAETPCIAKTHFQDAQPTTYGKRICDWMYLLTMPLDRVKYERKNIKGRGVKGTTGTQDSFMKLFNGDAEKIRKLDDIVCKKIGFDSSYTITTQTYPRIVDYHILSSITGIAVAGKKISTDIRLLQGAGEVSEPFKKSQVGSSAMAYKRNPMGSERDCGLSRHVFTGPIEAAAYASEQWLERTLDDSAERRIVIADSFLGIDAVLNLLLDTFSKDDKKRHGFRVYSKVAMKNLMEAMPFVITEEIMMNAVKAGGDRQNVHEIIRECSLKARENIDSGGKNSMFELMAQQPELRIDVTKEKEILNPLNYTGTASAQCKRFIEEIINPMLEEHSYVPMMGGDVKV